MIERFFLSHYYTRNILIYKFFEMPSFVIIILVISLFSFFLLRSYIGAPSKQGCILFELVFLGGLNEEKYNIHHISFDKYA
ncbi:hypothetical protein IFVP203_C2190277 [Vibrio parahaemolyticus]